MEDTKGYVVLTSVLIGRFVCVRVCVCVLWAQCSGHGLTRTVVCVLCVCACMCVGWVGVGNLRCYKIEVSDFDGRVLQYGCSVVCV